MTTTDQQKQKQKARYHKWLSTHQEQERERMKKKNRHFRLKQANWSEEQYAHAYAIQNGCCRICGAFCEVLCCDHCHKTGRARALLCNRCNLTLGQVQDNPWLLREMANYLEAPHG